jgi:hypothetical protein
LRERYLQTVVIHKHRRNLIQEIHNYSVPLFAAYNTPQSFDISSNQISWVRAYVDSLSTILLAHLRVSRLLAFLPPLVAALALAVAAAAVTETAFAAPFPALPAVVVAVAEAAVAPAPSTFATARVWTGEATDVTDMPRSAISNEFTLAIIPREIIETYL